MTRSQLEERYIELAAEQVKHLEDAKLKGLVLSLERYNREMAAHKRLLESVEKIRSELHELQEQFPGTMAAEQAENMQRSLTVQRVPAYVEITVLGSPSAEARSSNAPVVR